MTSTPRNATEVFSSGLRIGWALGLGQAVAILTGSTLAILVAGRLGSRLDLSGWLLLGILGVFPMAFAQPLTMPLLVPLIGGVLAFWGAPGRRLDAWFTICLTSGIITFAALGSVDSAWGYVLAALMLALVLGAWYCLRKFPAWRYERTVRQIEQERRDAQSERRG